MGSCIVSSEGACAAHYNQRALPATFRYMSSAPAPPNPDQKPYEHRQNGYVRPWTCAGAVGAAIPAAGGRR